MFNITYEFKKYFNNLTLPLMEGSQNKFLKSIHPHTIFVNESVH
jgi:hypothetical protein